MRPRYQRRSRVANFLLREHFSPSSTNTRLRQPIVAISALEGDVPALTDPHRTSFAREYIPRAHAQCAARAVRRALRANQRSSRLRTFVSMTKRSKARSSIVVTRVSTFATQPLLDAGGDGYHRMTAVERSRKNVVLRNAPAFVQHGTEPNARYSLARAVVAGPHVGSQVRLRSAAAGQDVGARAGAPRAGPLGLPELAATDLGTAALALVRTGDFDMLGLFATRHETSLRIALREVEFFAFDFLVLRLFVGKRATTFKNLSVETICASGLRLTSRAASAVLPRCTPRSASGCR